MITIKTKREIEIMKKAGRIVALCHQEIKSNLKPGMSTMDLDNLVYDVITKNDGIPTFKGYGGFSGNICASVNDEVIHGIPSKKNILKDGDIISVDIGVTYKGYVGDSAWSYPIGKIDSESERLLRCTKESLYAGLSVIKEGIHLSDISNAIEVYAKKENLGIVRDFAGHGVGSQLHEAPEILNYGPAGRGPILKAGMTLAIEPMLNLGTHRVKILSDGWTVKTCDKKRSAHFEHTVLVTETGYEILTKL